jgi:hypothetical protein
VKKLQTLFSKLYAHLRNERIVNKLKTTRVRDLERKIITLIDTYKVTKSINIMMDSKDDEIKTLKSKLKILQHDLAESRELISSYEERDLLASKNGRL